MKDKKIAQLNVGLPVSIEKEGAVYIAYTPALDISTFGSTKGEAKKSFNELVTIFFEEFIDNPDGLDVVLDSQATRNRDKGLLNLDFLSISRTLKGNVVVSVGRCV